MFQRLIQHWYQEKPHFLLYGLWPFTWIYRAARRLHWMYAGFQRKRQAMDASRPAVIIVGNLTVGGTGKTPFVIWLAQYLKAQGYSPGCISRGYRGSHNQNPQSVTPDSDPDHVGDEAVLIATQTHMPMVIGKNRAAALQHLMAKHDCDIVISDDGLQNNALVRDIEVVVIDAARGLGNGYCLPMGPLREPKARLKTVDLVIEQGEEPKEGQGCAFELRPTLCYALQHDRKHHSTVNALSLDSLKDKTIHAIAGIGHPERFFNTLKKLGAQVIAHPFPDHHRFSVEDINWGNKDSLIMMTEKDAIKCQSFADQRHYALAVRAAPNAALQRALQSLLARISHKLV